MRIAIASGKGGTGKTTLATNLALTASRQGRSVAYLDCDVEEPNGHLFLKPEILQRTSVGNLIPEVDEEKCTHCGQCGEICQYSAIVCLGQKVLVYPELCHACGGCSLVCPTNAITEVPREIGVLETGHAGPIHFVHGLLNVGEAMSPPVIRAVKAATPAADLVLVDAPPGASCPVIESVRGSDYVVLVTEPTPFGLNDLKLAVEMVRVLELRFGVVINRADVGDDEVLRYCHQDGIRILAEIRDDRRIAEAYSRGEMICAALPDYRALFTRLLEALTETASAAADGRQPGRARCRPEREPPR
ncbi:MAG: ATP-binding protein [Planctomycetes bacterium]|nr:ATP-binding protein [Planctomycetota bacterium]